jgi:two-component system nitrate/nitrite sensor histidine kinase NarX
VPDESDSTSATGGLADRLPPEVAAGLGAISRVARALNELGTLEELTEHALEEMRSALDFAAAALYIPDPGGRPVLSRFVECTDGTGTRDELVFDEDAWKLGVSSGHPRVFQETASWLVDNPFTPQARYWLVLPMVAADELVGVVVAARDSPIELDPMTVTVLRLLAEQLSTGVTTARLRRELLRAELERERTGLAAEVHDGIAQDLALAVRELALLEGANVSEPAAQASRARLREAVMAAHQVVRARLVDLASSPPLGGLRTALADVCDRFARRGLPVAIDADTALEASPAVTVAAMRILSEALSNVEKHAGATRIDVKLAVADGLLELRVTDDGAGFSASDKPDDSHIGLSVMRRRAADAGGALAVASTPGRGTAVTLTIPLERA